MGGPAMLNGIDVSVYQGQPNWDAVASSGISFAFAKVSEGVGFTDARWPYNAAALGAPGPIVSGAYHFGRPDLANSPEAEADWFWQALTAQVNATGWLLALDIELGSGNLAGWRDSFCARLSIHAGGYIPGWYTFWSFALAHGLNAPTRYWGWFAWPDSNGPLPDAAFSISFQQYGTIRVPGITGDVDADRFFGDLPQLQALTVGGAPATTHPGGSMFHPTIPGRIDDFVVGTDSQVYHLFGTDPSAPQIESWGGQGVPGSERWGWSPDGQHLICRVEGPADGRVYYRQMNVSGALERDWTPAAGVIAKLPQPGPQGPPGPAGPDTQLRQALKHAVDPLS